MHTGTFNGFENAEIFYREWNYNPSRKTIIIMHRGHEHSERMSEFASEQRFSEYNIFSYDLRGHGYTKQRVSGVFMDYVRDLDAFVKFLKKRYRILPEDIFIVANSITGVIVSAWIHDFAPQIAGIALLAPAFKIKLYVPFAKEFVSLGTNLNKNLIVKSYVKSKVLTHDPIQQKAYDNDPLITKSIDGKMLVDFLNAGKRIVEDAGAIDIPVILFSAGKDYVVYSNAQKDFFINLSSNKKEYIKLPDFYHGVLFEKDRSSVYAHLQRFIKESFCLKRTNNGLNPDKFTQNEYYKLSLRKIPLIESTSYAFQKWSLGKLGFMSKGMEIGLKYGFDSGISLDYIYKNKPKGKFGIGKMMDYFYLNAIGWRGIRLRKKNLLTVLEDQIIKLKDSNREVKILDIAGGTGNYLFDIKKNYPDIKIFVNDFKEENIKVGEYIKNKKNITGMQFTNYDCFDPETYKKINFSPNIIVISGIFELFENNELISRAITGAVSIAEPDSVLIYTGQPWHPQLKMIAYVLNSHQEKDWVMRRRSQRELDSVFMYNNVKKESMLIDEYGIFTVSCGIINVTQ